MSERSGPSARTLAAPLVALALASGCYMPGYNGYANPRTTPAGDVAAGVSMEVSGYSGQLDSEDEESYAAVMPPGVAFRLGLAERWDAGVEVGYTPAWSDNGGAVLALSSNVKWLVFPGEALDVALNPGFGVSHFDEELVDSKGYLAQTTLNHWELDAPVVVGINLNRHFVVVVSIGVVGGFYSSDFVPLDHDRRGRLIDGWAPRAALGFDVRTSESFALHPETSFVFATDDHNQRVIYTVGLACLFGRLSATGGASREQAPTRSAE